MMSAVMLETCRDIKINTYTNKCVKLVISKNLSMHNFPVYRSNGSKQTNHWTVWLDPSLGPTVLLFTLFQPGLV